MACFTVALFKKGLVRLDGSCWFWAAAIRGLDLPEFEFIELPFMPRSGAKDETRTRERLGLSRRDARAQEGSNCARVRVYGQLKVGDHLPRTVYIVYRVY